MANNFSQKIQKAISTLVQSIALRRTDEFQTKYDRRERIIVFIAAYVMAFSLWFIVNLNGNFSISINMPLNIGNLPEDMALTSDLPETVETEISGNGWQLLGLYNNPPTVPLDITEEEVNLFEQVRQRLSFEQDIVVSQVDPLTVTISMESKVTKKIPVIVNSRIRYKNRFGMIGDPVLSPDSITISGAKTYIDDIESWVVRDSLLLDNVNEDIALPIQLQNSNPLLTLSDTELSYSAEVSEFTEGETEVFVETRNLPRGQNVNYIPSMITIRYDVPIEQYSDAEKLNPFRVYVSYQKIIDDESGYVTPDIEVGDTEFDIRLRSFTPRSIAYFSVLDQ